MYYLRTRFYKAEIGRFIQRDTFAGNDQDPMSLNRYTYCQNEPVMYHDPVGQASISVRDYNPGKTVELIKNGSKPKSLKIYDAKGQLFDTLTYKKDFYIVNGVSYYTNVKINVSSMIKPVKSLGLRTTLAESGFTNVMESTADGKRKVTAVYNKKHYIFYEGVDYTFSRGLSFIDYDKTGNIVAPPKYKAPEEFDKGNSAKEFPKEIASYLYWQMGVQGNAADYAKKWEEAKETANQWNVENAQRWAGYGMWFLPTGSVVGGTVGKATVKAGEKKIVSSIEKELLELSAKDIEKYAIKATKNPSSNKVMLGKYSRDGLSYDKLARDNNMSYFHLEEWDSLAPKVGNNKMWSINESFLQQQLNQGKTFYFSHDPVTATSSYWKEVNFFKEAGYHFIKDGQFWKAVK